MLIDKLYARCIQDAPFADILGMVYQSLASNYGTKALGQYFTPEPLANMMAKMTYNQQIFENQHAVRFSEPASGSGIMVLSFMKTVFEDSPDYMKKLSVTVVDLDVTCVKMSVLQVLANNLIHQLNLGEIKAFQGNSLGDPAKLNSFYHASTPEFDALMEKQRKREVRHDPSAKIPKKEAKLLSSGNIQTEMF